MIAAVAPEVPAALLFAVGLAAGVTALFLFFLRFCSITVIGSLLRWIASALSVIPFVGGWSAELIESGVNAVDRALGAAIAASENLASQMLGDAWKLTRWVGDSIAHLATETLHGFRVMIVHTVPGIVARATAPLIVRIGRLERAVTHLEQTTAQTLQADVAAVEAQATSAEHRIGRTIRHVEAQATADAARLTGELAVAEHAITVTLPRAVGAAEADVRGWTGKQLRRLSRRLTRVEEAVSVGALTAAVVGVIAREFSWVRCPNMKTLGRAACRTPAQDFERVVEDLLLGAAAIYVALDLEEFAQEMQAVIHDTALVVGAVWGVVPESELASIL